MKVFVSGCFDLLHSGHVTFLQEAAKYGNLYVGVGSDKTIEEIKGVKPIYTQEERKYILQALRCVHKVFINLGIGKMDFIQTVLFIQPDIFYVNEDGAFEEKTQFCKKHNIKMIIHKRIPFHQLPRRSTTQIKQCINDTI
jgi:cytidyltransferase-like protein